MDEDGLGFVQLAELGGEFFGHDVDVLNILEVPFVELIGGADVDDDDFAFLDEF